jgi:hypothetical protein
MDMIARWEAGSNPNTSWMASQTKDTPTTDATATRNNEGLGAGGDGEDGKLVQGLEDDEREQTERQRAYPGATFI